ncbi:hypothetical protein [uncultured Aquimarina sp.]|uniref:hypothetical protein n=1 Tax=uncultured Aquimarina sp. TaxID=575652 RepID=UPI00260186B0|nr:hypothetical protein [uncultured Aquimarina sp.]
MKTNNYLSLLFICLTIFQLSGCEDPIKTTNFTIKAGAMVETLYLNVPNGNTSIASKLLPAYAKTVSSSGGEVLATFEVTQLPDTDRKMTHIVLIQWTDPSKRTGSVNKGSFKKIVAALGSENIQYGFFGSQQDTPVTLSSDKIYDFTSAWFISDDPCTFPSLFGVLGTYFSKIPPVLQEYKISQTAFFGPHPAMPKTETNVFVPHMFGIFEWQKFEDRELFNKAPRYTEHVDIRNSVLKKMDVVFAKAI